MHCPGFRLLHACAAAVVAITGMLPGNAVSATSAPASIRLSQAQMGAAAIKVVVARAADDADAVPSTGGWRLTGTVTVPPNDTGVILSAVSGQIERVFVHIGQTIRAGDRLARIYSGDVLSMQRNYLHARSNAEVVSNRLTRDKTLFREGIIAEARLRETEAAQDMAVATQREQRRLLRLVGYSDAEINSLKPDSIAAWVTLRADNNAVVLEQPAQVGQHIEAGAPLFKLATRGKWWLELEATRAQAADIQLGDRTQVEGCSSEGHVIAVGSQLQIATQTLTIRAQMPEGLSCITPNQFIQAQVLPSTTRAMGLVTVPASALVRNGGGDFVFVEKSGDFQPTPVSIARRRGSELLLSAGIKPGTRIASSGLMALKGAWLGLGAQSASAGAH